MKNAVFYAVMPEPRKSKKACKTWPIPFTRAGIRQMDRCECLAVDVGDPCWRRNPEGAALAIDGNMSSVCWSGLSLDYLRDRCVRISESEARRLHVELIRYMER